MTQIFISYSRKDLTFVERLAADLKNSGLDAWYDLSNLEGGSRWHQAIEQAIKDSQSVLVVLSPEALASKWVEKEVLFAEELGKKIIPLYYRSCKPGMFYSNLNRIDAQDENYRNNFDKILRALNVPIVRQVSNLIKPAAPVHENHPVIETPKPAQVVTLSDKPTLSNGNVIDSSLIAGAGNPISDLIKNAEKPPVIETPKPAQVITPPNKLTLSNGMDFMRVPAGKFLMGSDNGDDDEKPQHSVAIPYDYWMARFPVTNEQYNLYVKAKGINHPISDWEKKKDHPVVNVDWNTVMEYCRWLNSLLKNELQAGFVLKLPTEAEWEKAARSTDGREFPWGNEFDKNKCNSSEGGKGKTTSVYLYSSHGDSMYGCSNMSGNVWEWMRSEYKPYPYNESDGREDKQKNMARVLRGGAYRSESWYLRCACRLRNNSSNWDGDISFRVVIAPPLS